MNLIIWIFELFILIQFFKDSLFISSVTILFSLIKLSFVLTVTVTLVSFAHSIIFLIVVQWYGKWLIRIGNSKWVNIVPWTTPTLIDHRADSTLLIWTFWLQSSKYDFVAVSLIPISCSFFNSLGLWHPMDNSYQKAIPISFLSFLVLSILVLELDLIPWLYYYFCWNHVYQIWYHFH